MDALRSFNAYQHPIKIIVKIVVRHSSSWQLEVILGNSYECQESEFFVELIGGGGGGGVRTVGSVPRHQLHLRRGLVGELASDAIPSITCISYFSFCFVYDLFAF